jgi:dnd system-associated protein 4
MADTRIRIDKNKSELVKRLVSDEKDTAPFRMYVDLIAFAAALGASKRNLVPLGEIANDPAPIRQSVFERQGYDTIINLLAMYNNKDPLILADSEEKDNERTRIFEEYANGGLQILEEELRGAVDYLETILLIIADQRRLTVEVDETFDLQQYVE